MERTIKVRGLSTSYRHISQHAILTLLSATASSLAEPDGGPSVKRSLAHLCFVIFGIPNPNIANVARSLRFAPTCSFCLLNGLSGFLLDSYIVEAIPL